MSIQNYKREELYPHHLHTNMRHIHRSTTVLALCAILGLIGSLLLSVTSPHIDSRAATANSVTYTTTQSTFTHVLTPQSLPTKSTVTPLTTSSTPSSSSSSSTTPITPFPPLLWQEIAALQAQNRFLYYGNQFIPEVTLTFDDGPSPYYTPQILAVLQRYNIQATFFCIGRQVAQYPALIKQEYATGNIVGNHSWSHPNLALLSSNEILAQINSTSDAIQQAIGVRPTFFRPPYGIINANVLTQANQLGLTTIIWNDEARDWTTPGIDVISSRILGLASNGAIILLHDGGGDRSQTVAALPTIITSLQARGFKIVSLPQMMHDLPLHPASNVAPTPPTTTPTIEGNLTPPTTTPTTEGRSTSLIPSPTFRPTALALSEPLWKQGST